MAPPPEHTEPEQQTARDAFVRQLPKRIAAIEDIWARLSSTAWDSEQLDALYARIREVSEGSKAYALFQLSESVFSLEVYLSSFVGSDIRPGPSQVDAISGLVRALKTAANVTTSEQQAAAVSPGLTVFLLGEPQTATAGLGEALGRLGCEVRHFRDSRSLLEALQPHPPMAIVADTAMLPEMPALSAELVRLRNHISIEIPLVFVSNSTALQLRVDAIRAGGYGYFVTPLDLAAVAAQIRDLATPDQTGPYRVLLVEDDPTQAHFAASILRKAGIEVLEVTEPVRVMESLRTFRPHLILMDIYMPDVNGIELTTIIRDHKEFVAIPIVFLSGEQDTDKQLDALSVGGDDFIAKPIRPKHLLGVVQTRIRRARQLLNATGQPAKHDRVTGLFSRQHFLDRVAGLLDGERDDNIAAVVLVRPDRLHRLQDQVGVGGLDHLLAQIGERIADLVGGETDLAARIDEHSFGILLKRSAQEQIVELCERILNEVSTHEFTAGLQLSCSAGVCFIDDELDDVTGIISRARTACDTAGEHGGNRVHTHSASSDSQEVVAQPQDDPLQRVRQALHQDGFVIQYQPLLDLQTRGSETYEVVLHLANQQGDLISGQQLRDIAQAGGICEELDQWILERALEILKKRRESGRRTRIFVHQSACSALSESLPAWLLGRLRAKQIVGTGLVMDFRLPDLSRNLRLAQQNIKALGEMDVEVSLSRFPEKDAAFRVLRFLQARYINIAPRLLKADRDVISSVIRQAHEASAKVIVSNVDDPRSIDLHWSSGADFLQGNFIQRPLENMDYDFSQVVI